MITISNIIILIFLSIFIIGLIFIIYACGTSKHYNSNLKKNNSNPSFCILIPARDESEVISSPLKSLQKQTTKVNASDIYIIVEDKNDKTCAIAKKYKTNIFIRKNLLLKRKGYALDEVIKHLISNNKHYDMYFIIDADNYIDKDFIKNMIIAYKKGYDIGVGNRNSKNNKDGIIAICSLTTFSVINLLNKKNSQRNKNAAISGTGFFIKGTLIEKKWKGFPFHELTEDYEMTLYNLANDISSTYVEDALFYDEQPTTLKCSITQRTRWVKGFLDSRKKQINSIKKKYHSNPKKYNYLKPAILGITPYIITIVGLIGLLSCSLITSFIYLFINTKFATIYFLLFITISATIYLILAIATSIIITINKKSYDIKTSMKLKTILYNPLFLSTYIICLIKALKNKNLDWKKIEHLSK